MLDIARVVEIRPESHAVDIEMMRDGRRIAGVQVMARSGGTDMGLSDLSSPALSGYGTPNSAVRDIYAVVAHFGTTPIVLGFLFPQVSQVLFPDRDRMVYRHASDVYTTIDAQGNTELSHPSGTFLRIGKTAPHEDLTGKDYDKLWAIKRNTDAAVNVQLTVKNAGAQVASINIDPSGNVTIDHAGNLSVSAGGAMRLESGGNMTFVAPRIDLNP